MLKKARLVNNAGFRPVMSLSLAKMMRKPRRNVSTGRSRSYVNILLE
jgi:hypothetical protein